MQTVPAVFFPAQNLVSALFYNPVLTALLLLVIIGVVAAVMLLIVTVYQRRLRKARPAVTLLPLGASPARDWWEYVVDPKLLQRDTHAESLAAERAGTR